MASLCRPKETAFAQKAAYSNGGREGNAVRVIYLDSLLLLNGAADYFLLRLTARLAGEGPRRLRLALGALLGA